MKPSGGRPQRPAPSSTRRTHQCWPERPAESGAVLLWPLSGPRGTLPCLFSWSLVLGKRVMALREGLRPGRQRRCHELLGGGAPHSADGASAGDSLSHATHCSPSRHSCGSTPLRWAVCYGPQTATASTGAGHPTVRPARPLGQQEGFLIVEQNLGSEQSVPLLKTHSRAEI